MLTLTSTLDTLSRIAIANAALLRPAIGIVLLLAARRHLGRWPDLWRARRAVLPLVADVGDGEYESVDDRVDVIDLEEEVPEKTELPLYDDSFAGTIDAPPAVVREELREMDRVWPAWLASIQYDVHKETGEPVYEVGSYAFRPGGFLDARQVHVRLTPVDGGRRTRLWAHREYSPWAHPVMHYRGESWSSSEGVHWVATLFASDDRFDPSDRAIELVES
ncbi:hypothetical protein BJ1_gp02 [Halorubrum virus BJ1]|uniref:SRPBCC family protein n=1 Tax=Halorubrum virus BJ1 TaxID=416419 RepID=A0ZYL5_9CAUD|nr:hypothetical protein BJ1_gp02 [Halorubrum virus BJ1]CAL92424.1 hypothetical protein [Halorubrum virus BJ1]